MGTFNSLIELTHELSVGDKLAWVGEHAIESARETTTPNTITKIESGSEWIRVDGEGIGGGEYYYKAYQDGSSEAFYVNPSSDSDDYRGAVVMARLTDSDAPVPVVRVYDDLR